MNECISIILTFIERFLSDNYVIMINFIPEEEFVLKIKVNDHMYVSI